MGRKTVQDNRIFFLHDRETDLEIMRKDFERLKINCGQNKTLQRRFYKHRYFLFCCLV